MSVKKRIGILISFGFAERNLKCARISDLLVNAGYDVDLNQDINHVGLAARFCATLKFWLAKRLAHRFGLIQGYQKALARKDHRNDRTIAKSDRFQPSLGFPFPKSKSIFFLLHWAFKKMPTTIKKTYKPDLVVLTDLQYLLAQNAIRYCENNEIPIVAINASWDHLTHRSKALDSPMLKLFLVWNHIQAEEAVNYHGISREKIKVVGAMHFDRLHHMRTDFVRDDIREKYSVTSEDKIIFLPAYSRRLGEREPAVINHLLHHLKSIDRIKIIIRPYPNDPDFYNRFSHVINHPRVSVIDLNSTNDDEDFRVISELLYAADIVLTGCSTAAIEAMYYDTPVIHLGIDQGQKIGKQALFKKYFFSDHYKHIMKHKASFYVQTYGELLNAVQVYFEDLSTHRRERQLVVKEQVAYTDGQSGRRIIEHIKDELPLG